MTADTLDPRFLGAAAVLAFLAVSILFLELGRWLDNRPTRSDYFPVSRPRRTLPRPVSSVAPAPRLDTGRAFRNVKRVQFYDQEKEA